MKLRLNSRWAPFKSLTIHAILKVWGCLLATCYLQKTEYNWVTACVFTESVFVTIEYILEYLLGYAVVLQYIFLFFFPQRDLLYVFKILDEFDPT